MENQRPMWKAKLWHWASLFLIIFELIGVRSRQKDDTLTEYVWSKTNHPAVLGLVGGVAGWLPYHFTYGYRIPLTRWDLLFVAGGAVMGVHSWYVRRGDNANHASQ